MGSGNSFHKNEANVSRMSQNEVPVAIVGMACRFPGAPSISDFWRLLAAGRNSVTEGLPGSGNRRIDELFSNVANPGGACRFCAYVDDIEQFDAQFFRISPVEAEWLDPQQRMMLETSWQALEDAGMDPNGLKGSLTGVYTGISNDEYRMLVVESSKPAEAASCLYALSGTNLNGTSGRVAFVLGLMGPSKAVDAACASSLVAVHDAVSDLQQKKADMAIVGGVQAILNGRIFELRSDAMMLSPDGQCKTFDASANGYVRGEGCGVVVLKRLSDAEADGDRIWGVIRGSAVNHGGASTGLTVPHTPALEQVIETALSQAGIPPSEVDYLEAHGTGTAVGDPIELNAVAAVYGKGRKAERPLLVGSVKTNLGHLESAAGIAGLIKAVLVLQRGVIPKHLHFRSPSPAIDWDGLPLRVTSDMMDLPERAGRPCVAGVNSFGISGTNAHIVLEQYGTSNGVPSGQREVRGSARAVTVALPEAIKGLRPAQKARRQREARLLPLSGKTPTALRDLAEQYLEWLDEHTDEIASDSSAAGPLLSDMAWTAGVGRSHFESRFGIVFPDAASLKEQLRALAASSENDQPRTVAKVAFAYTGQGSQWTGMGQALYEREPVARAVLDRCEEVFRAVRGVSLLDVMFGRTEGNLSDTAWEQPALYALECALTALWSSVGLQPSVVIGHSVGEIAAAQAAGVLSLEDGMRFAAARGTVLSETAPGGMVAIFASPSRVASVVENLNGKSAATGLSISADNGTHQVVSGLVEDIEAVSKHFESEGVRVRRLETARAFHSALVEPALDALETSLDGVAVNPPSLTVVSNLTGRALEPGQLLDGAYWKRHARQAVAFARGIRTVAELGTDLIVEIGPRPVLTNMSLSAWPESVQAPVVIPSLCPPSDDAPGSANGAEFLRAVADAYRTGIPVRFEGLFAGEARRRISLPGYPFQRERYWIESTRHRRPGAGHPLLGIRHESASGEATYETELFRSDPEWMNDHQVFGRVIAPGALYGSMMALACLAEQRGAVVVEDVQLHNALIFQEEDSEDDSAGEGRTVQTVLESSEAADGRRIQIFSKGGEEAWTLHVEGRISSGARLPDSGGRVDLDRLKAVLSPVDVASYYRARAGTGIDLGRSFRTLKGLWSKPGEALGEVSVPDTLGRNGLEVHPLLLDGCFQVVAAARNPGGVEDGITYLPFGWQQLWLTGRLPEQVVCHVQMSESPQGVGVDSSESREVMSGELRIYDTTGIPLGGLSGYMVKRATRAALLSAVEGVKDLLYEIVWRDRALAPGMLPADFLPSPAAVAERSGLLSAYLAEEGVEPRERTALLRDLERWSRSRALMTLENLGWLRSEGEVVSAEELRQRLGVVEDHKRVFRRMLEMLAKSSVLEEVDGDFVVRIASGDPLPDEMPRDMDAFATRMAELYPHGATEIGLFKRCGGALADVLRGQADPLTLLFSSGDPTPGDLYLKAPVARAANRILRETVRTLVSGLPEDRHLRIIEVGAGTGSATAAVLPELPEGRFDYMYTDISAGFFAEAEARFGGSEASIEYRPLDVEKDPVAQGFGRHAYDLMIASNVLHATRYLEETLAHCRELLAPSGQLVALENLSGQGWMDLTFGQLDGWWRFADDYRPHHALASPAVWRRALGDAGFGEVAILGLDESDQAGIPDKGVIVAQGPIEVAERPGVWVLASDTGGAAEELAAELAAQNQTVVLAQHGATDTRDPKSDEASIVRATLDVQRRESWRALLKDLPGDAPLSGVVHLVALDGHGFDATTIQMSQDTKRVVASALALTQALLDADATPEKGVSLLTRGAQVLEKERAGQLAGATLWGFGKALAREAVHLQPRMIDLDPGELAPASDLVNELLNPDAENHIAYRFGRRRVARLVRANADAGRLDLPDESAWALAPDPDGVFDRPCVKPLPPGFLEPKEVRVAVEAAGLNFWDVFRSLGFIEEGNLGREMCGYIIDVGSEVSTVSIGDHVVGLGFGAFAAEMVTREELVAPAPSGFTVTDLATVPSAFVSAALSYELSGLEAGDKVLIHAGSGGVGLAAIQLAQAAGAEVFTTASAPKQGYLRSLGVRHVFNSRETDFGQEILEVTEGAGVDVVLNSLTSEGFIEASLLCLAKGGRFVELARRDILTEEEMAAVRPDVGYSILELDVLKKTEPEWVGRVLRAVLKQLREGDIHPLVHSRWPLAEAGAALRFMRSARHLGKIVVTTSPLERGELRQHGTYLVTGGLGGIGLAVANWLAERGARTIVLNGRRQPDSEARDVIGALQARGITVRVALADVTDSAAVDEMLATVDQELPPLVGVIHSVGVLSDGALGNQSWERFEQVLWPKVVGAWHLHRATADRSLDLFMLFSSRVGVMGNPGQANHAAANAFLDQLAAHRQAIGLPGQAIAWGAWSDIGEAAEQRERIERRRAALGGRWFTPQQGIRALEKLIRQDVTNSVVMSMDWTVFQEAVEDRPALLEDLLITTAEGEEDSPALSEDLMTRLRQTPVAEQEELFVSFLQQELKAVLRLPSEPSPTVGFFDLGMDSLMAVELRNRLNRAFADEYVASNTVVFDYPDIASLAHHLAEELGGLGAGPAASVQPEAKRRDVAQVEEDRIAVVGMACRLPGAPDIATFWRMLVAGRDTVTDGRRDTGPWSGAVGDPAAKHDDFRRGGFVEGLDHFDAGFFGIRPIEARMMDPRQRLLLETSWQALEDANMDPSTLRSSHAGVYAGIGSSEYRDLISASGREDSYLGTAGSVALGRIAYTLGLMGPAIPVDMTCASSLVAVHQAVAALQRGEVDLALAGGVHAVLSPAISRFMREYGMLSASGKCRTFDAGADGFVRGEGCGMVVLKRLGDAVSDGDHIWGLIRGSAVNQNGASAGLTVPNGRAQEQVLEEALARAGIQPAEVDYVEVHGTGSQLGDPIEVRAAAAVYGEGREPTRPLLLGTVKTNIGHLEAAAGVAGLIKVMLAMKQGVIPKHLHFEDPNPHVDWDQLPVQVTAEAVKWPSAPERPPRAGVSAFAISGTNAHVVVEGYGSPNGASSAEAERPIPSGSEKLVSVDLPVSVAGSTEAEGLEPRRTRLMPLSGKSDAALRDLARRYLSWLDELSAEDSAGSPLLADMAWTAGVGRSHFSHRAGLVFDSSGTLRRQLESLAESADSRSAANPQATTAFAFAGENGQWTGMGEQLYRTEPVARAILDRCDEVLRADRGASLLDVMFGGSGELDDPAWTVPAVFALNVALAELWSSAGLRPSVVFGKGPGELAAAYSAGVFALEDALRTAAHHGVLKAACSEANGAGAALDEFELAVKGMSLSPPSRSIVSGLTGRLVGTGKPLDAAYWRRQASEPMAFEACVQTLANMGVDILVEIGPDVSLSPMVVSAWPGQGEQAGLARSKPPTVLASLRRPSGGMQVDASELTPAVAHAYELGLDIDFAALFAGEWRSRISLPGYPFQRRPYWFDTA